MSEIKIFEHEEFGRVRTIEIDSEIWFVGKDVAVILGYTNPNEALSDHVDEEDKLNSKMLSSFDLNIGQRGGWLINESGLYSLILSSKLISAKAFKKWVTSEVLPSIRKYGVYATPLTIDSILADPDMAIRLLQDLKQERERTKALEIENNQKTQIIGELQPKANYVDTILQNQGLVTITQIAKDYGMTGQAMNQKLAELGIQFKQSGQWMLYKEYHGLGYTHSKTFEFYRSNGEKDIGLNTEWTQKGRLFLYEKLKSVDVIPVIELD